MSTMALSAAMCDVSGAGPMLIIGHSPETDEPNADGLRLIKRGVSKPLGVSPGHFTRLPMDHPSFKTTRLPLFGLALGEFEHLLPADAVRKANVALQELTPRVLRAHSYKRGAVTRTRHVSRTSLRRSEKARKH